MVSRKEDSGILRVWVVNAEGTPFVLQTFPPISMRTQPSFPSGHPLRASLRLLASPSLREAEKLWHIAGSILVLLGFGGGFFGGAACDG